MGESEEHVFGEAEPEFRCLTGARPTLAGQVGSLALAISFCAVGFGALWLHEFLPWGASPPALVVVGALITWGGILLVGIVAASREAPWGRFTFGEQIEVTLVEGWHALLSWGEVLSYRERGAGVELHTTRPPPRPNKAGILPDLPQTLWVPTRDKAERARLLRLLKAKRVPRLR